MTLNGDSNLKQAETLVIELFTVLEELPQQLQLGTETGHRLQGEQG